MKQKFEWLNSPPRDMGTGDPEDPFMYQASYALDELFRTGELHEKAYAETFFGVSCAATIFNLCHQLLGPDGIRIGVAASTLHPDEGLDIWVVYYLTAAGRSRIVGSKYFEHNEICDMAREFGLVTANSKCIAMSEVLISQEQRAAA